MRARQTILRRTCETASLSDTLDALPEGTTLKVAWLAGYDGMGNAHQKRTEKEMEEVGATAKSKDTQAISPAKTPAATSAAATTAMHAATPAATPAAATTASPAATPAAATTASTATQPRRTLRSGTVIDLPGEPSTPPATSTIPSPADLFSGANRETGSFVLRYKKHKKEKEKN